MRIEGLSDRTGSLTKELVGLIYLDLGEGSG